MGIKYYFEPELKSPDLVIGWPGIGNVGIIAVDTLRRIVRAEQFAEIESQEFFYPKKLVIKNSVLTELSFPTNKFYYRKTNYKDLMFFIGEEQPSEPDSIYAKGSKAYKLANLVLDVAQKFGCQRIYTSGAAVSLIHHTSTSKVWFVPNKPTLIKEAEKYKNVLLMGGHSNRTGQGNISGLNGLLLGVAKKRGLDGICLMGEVPIYLQGFPIPYPKASKSVIEILTAKLGVKLDLSSLENLSDQVEIQIEQLYEKIPIEVREKLDQLKYTTYTEETAETITEEDKNRIMADVDKFFQRTSGED